jgi:hypothetical protein
MTRRQKAHSGVNLFNGNLAPCQVGAVKRLVQDKPVEMQAGVVQNWLFLYRANKVRALEPRQYAGHLIMPAQCQRTRQPGLVN